jgi:hypothetical protein
VGLLYNQSGYNARTSLLVAAATAAFVGSASFAAQAHYIRQPQAAFVGAAITTFDSTHTNAIGASFSGRAYLQPTGRLVNALSAQFAGTADLQAFVLRTVLSATDLGGAADLVVIPASTFAEFTLTGTADLVADATHVLPGQASFLGSVDWALDATAYRMASADLTGAALLWLEAGINGDFPAYANLNGVAGFDPEPVRSCFGVSALDVQAEFTPGLTLIHRAHMSATGVGGVFVAEPEIWKGAFVDVAATGDFAADALRVVLPESTTTGTAEFTAHAWQRHAVQAAFAGSATTNFAGAYIWWRSVGFSGRADFTGNGARVVLPEASLLGRVEVHALAGQIHAAETDFAGDALATFNGLVPVPKQASAGFDGNAELRANGTFIREGEFSALGTAGITLRFIYIGRGNVGGLVTFPKDPECRTFVRPETTREFDRPERERLFVRRC